MNSKDDFWDVFVKIEEEKVGDGYAGDVFKVKRKGDDGMVYAAKCIKEHAFWTVENEIKAFGIVPRHQNITKLRYVFDKRDQEDKEVKKNEKENESEEEE
jgi:serine/threonine protein kinase